MIKVKDTGIAADAINEARKINKINESIDILYCYTMISEKEKQDLINRLNNKTWQH